jgi:hypothetical protein
MKIIRFNDYIKESDYFEQPNDKKYLNDILMMPLEKRKELIEILKKGEINESENLFSTIKGLEYKFKAYASKKALSWLINLSEKELNKKIKTLNLFDPTDFSNIKKVETIYLGGGIDKTPDVYEIRLPDESMKNPYAIVGLRNSLLLNIIEKIKANCPEKLKEVRRETEPMDNNPYGYFNFSVDRGTDLSFLSKEELSCIVPIGGGGNWRYDIENMFGQEHVVQSVDIFNLSYTGKFPNMKNYKKPLILNPLRKEQSTRDNPEFRKIYGRWKKGMLNQTEKDDEFKFMANVINKDIKAPDLRVLNACDTNLVKYDAVAGDGTKGELQFGAFKQGHNMFMWLDGGYNISDVSPWTFPEATKIVRNQKELLLLIESIKKINGLI